MNYKNREQYKHLMRVLAVAAIVLLECAVFSVFWDRYYASHLWLEPFWDKGNQIIVVIYGIFLLVFMYIYGGMKIGYMKGSSIIYSQMMTAFCANALMYLQIILLWRHLPYILPMVGMTLVDFALAGIVSWLFEKTFARLFPPREVLLIYARSKAASASGQRLRIHSRARVMLCLPYAGPDGPAAGKEGKWPQG